MDTASMKTKMKPSSYSAGSFHGVRLVSALSAIIVSAVLVFFCKELKNEGYKIPWTFLIVLAASLLTLISLILTTCIHLCTRLSPIFNLIINTPLLLLWLIGLALLTWNIYGTLAHSCSLTNFGNDDGILICKEYKAMYSFVVFGALSQIAMVVVDVRARITQTRSGRYAKMRDSTSEVKLESYASTHAGAHSQKQSQSASIHDAPYQDTTQQYRDEPGWRPGQRTNTVASSRVGDYGRGEREASGEDG